ncbi:MAG: hypothetical protein MUF10_17580 [Thermoanaerobaculaceae bacterium]|jgi:hypothetical protein|nr:hypothetical protein [Thermoanaerobaculaceae bacterium]
MSDQLAREFVPVASSRRTARLWFAGSMAMLVLLLGWLGGGYLWPGTLRYEVTTENLVVTTGRNLAHDVTTIPLGRIFETSSVILRNGKLHFGKEKPEFCVGYFEFPTQGEVYLATNCGESGVLIRGGGLTTALVVSPAEPEKLMFAIRNHQPGVFAPPPRQFASYAGWLALYLLIFLLGTGALLTAFVIGPARLRYRVLPGELEVTSLGKPFRVRLAGAKVRRHRPLLGERMSGIVLPGYIVGSFQYDSAPTTVLASAKEEGVLYEGEGRVFLTPADIDGLLAALEAAGATLVVTTMQRRR